MATVELWRSGYRMRGFLSFDEHFSADRARYYESLQMGLPVNFYEGRDDPDHTPWLIYFVGTLARAATALHERAALLHRAAAPAAPPWEALARRQQQVLTRLLARILDGIPRALEIQPADIQEWFLPLRTQAGLRIRRYRPGPRWASLLERAR